MTIHKYILPVRSGWFIQSNALERSVRRIPNSFPLTIAFLNFSIITRRQCLALNSFWKSHWLGNSSGKIIAELVTHQLFMNFREVWKDAYRSTIFFFAFFVFLICWNNSVLLIIRKFIFVNTVVKMFVNEIWEIVEFSLIILVRVSLVWTLFVFKSRITFETSSKVVFPNEKAESKFLFVILRMHRYFSIFSMIFVLVITCLKGKLGINFKIWMR